MEPQDYIKAYLSYDVVEMTKDIIMKTLEVFPTCKLSEVKQEVRKQLPESINNEDYNNELEYILNSTIILTEDDLKNLSKRYLDRYPKLEVEYCDFKQSSLSSHDFEDSSIVLYIDNQGRGKVLKSVGFSSDEWLIV